MHDPGDRRGGAGALATSPNPWVGAVVRAADGSISEGATREVGREHAEIVAGGGRGGGGRNGLRHARALLAHGSCTAPCADALIEAGVARVVVVPPIPTNGSTATASRRRAAGITVDVGLYEDRGPSAACALHQHRTTGRPWVVLKLAASMDGATAAPDGSSQWITGAPAR